MSTVLKFQARPKCQSRENEFRDLRKSFGLSILQAAQALEVSASTLENWEQLRSFKLTIAAIESSYQRYSNNLVPGSGKNVLFGSYPLRLARMLLRLDVEQIASEFGYTEAAWLKIESNARILTEDKIEVIEDRLRAQMADLCH